MTNFIQLTIFGLSNGAILALAALGFVLIYKASGVINFAQGEFLLVGAYAFYGVVVVAQLPWYVGIAVSLSVALVLGVVVERTVLRPMLGAEPIAVIMATIGLSSVLLGGVQVAFGTAPKARPDFLPTGSAQVGDLLLPWDRLVAVAAAAVALTAFTLFFTRSRHGIAIRAVADDQQAAMTVGISSRRVFALSWALAAMTAVLAGVLLGSITGVAPSLAGFGLVVFPVVILGGLDSVPGTIAGGVVIGLLTQYIGGYVDGSLQQVVPYLVLVAILLLRPHGLFGQTRIRRV
jgi:branched-chain amino acid transport system permease protein